MISRINLRVRIICFHVNACLAYPWTRCNNPETAVLFCRRYKLVSHPNNLNPFLASFLGYRCSIRLHRVTTENSTFMRIHCAFKTEKEAAGIMKATWERIHLDFLLKIKQQCNTATKEETSSVEVCTECFSAC